jgi:ribosomal protein S18 acetylase RimI-like enzyme
MEIKKGLSEKNIGQLIDYANKDEEVKRFTSDARRFKDRESYEEWLKKGRTIYGLVDGEDNLLGITWFGEEGGEGFTLAIRTYEGARHRGFSYGFLKETINDFMGGDEYKKAINKEWWLETSKDNLPAIMLYEKLGFQKEREGKSPDKVIFRRRPGFVS